MLTDGWHCNGMAAARQFGLYLDILGTPRRFFFEQLSLFASDPEESERLLEMSTVEGGDLYYNYCLREHRTYVEVLEVRLCCVKVAWNGCSGVGGVCIVSAVSSHPPQDFKSVTVPVEMLLELIPTLQPRSFSIASSQHAHPTQVHLCVAVVEYTTPYNRQKQVCIATVSMQSPSAAMLIVLAFHNQGVCSSWLSALVPGKSVIPLWWVLYEDTCAPRRA